MRFKYNLAICVVVVFLSWRSDKIKHRKLFAFCSFRVNYFSCKQKTNSKWMCARCFWFALRWTRKRVNKLHPLLLLLFLCQHTELSKCQHLFSLQALFHSHSTHIHKHRHTKRLNKMKNKPTTLTTAHTRTDTHRAVSCIYYVPHKSLIVQKKFVYLQNPAAFLVLSLAFVVFHSVLFSLAVFPHHFFLHVKCFFALYRK